MNDAKQPEALFRAAALTLSALGYTYHGGEQWKPPVGKPPAFDLIDSQHARIAVLEREKAAQHYRILVLEAELEAVGAGGLEPLRKREQEYAIQDAHAATYSLDADPQGIRARVADAINGALALGVQGSGTPPDGHWLAPFWMHARFGVIQYNALRDATDALLAAPASQAQEDARAQHDRDSAELRRLCEDRDKARRERDLCKAESAGLESSCGHLGRLVDELRAKAERYDFLRDRDLDAIRDGGIFAGKTPDNVVLNGDDLDAAIDAARAAKGGDHA